MTNAAFIATSLDGYIADKHNKIDFLESIPNPDKDDLGYVDFISRIDAIVMGKTTFDIVRSFDIEWPYTVKVFVLTHQDIEIPETLIGKVETLQGTPKEVLKTIHAQQFFNLYIDGGNVIQQFIEADLLDDIIITTIPVLLGVGVPLFGTITEQQEYTCLSTKLYIGQVPQSHYRRIKAKV